MTAINEIISHRVEVLGRKIVLVGVMVFSVIVANSLVFLYLRPRWQIIAILVLGVFGCLALIRFHWGLTFLFFLIPLDIVKTVGTFDFRISEVLILILFTLFMFKKLTVRNQPAYKTRLHIPILVYAGVRCLFLALSGDSVFASREILNLVELIMLFYVIVGSIKTKKEFYQLSFSMVASVSILALYALYQALAKDNFFLPVYYSFYGLDMYRASLQTALRARATFLHANTMACYLVMLLPLSLAGYFLSKSSVQRLFSGMAVLLMSGSLLITYSRSNWLVFVFLFLVLVLPRVKKYRMLILTIILVVGIAGFLMPTLLLPERLQSLIQWKNDVAIRSRLDVWPTALEMIKSFPLLGTGIEPVVGGYSRLARLSGLHHAHNLYLQIFMEMGLVGLGMITLIFVSILRKGFRLVRKMKDNQLAMISFAYLLGMTGFLLSSLAEYYWWQIRFHSFWWFYLAMVISGINIMQKERLSEKIGHDYEG